MLRPLLLALLLAPTAFAQRAAEPVDTSAVAFFKAEATERGQVMDHAMWMTDVLGPRLTQSPGLDAAQVWARDRFASFGVPAALEPWGTLGRGWSIDRFALQARVAGPDAAAQTFPLYGAPKAWSPSLGTAAAELVVIDPDTDDDLDRLAGSLRGKVVLLATIEEVPLGLEPLASRHDAHDLLGMANAGTSSGSGRSYSPEAIARYRAQQRRTARLFAEAPLAILTPSGTPGAGAIRAMGAQMPVPEGASFTERPQPWAPDATTVPQFVIQDEQSNRLVRLAQAGQQVDIALDFAATFTPPAPEENVIAEIRGSDLADELVILGGHFDSWHSGTGATDNAAGSAVMMEAARLLQAYYDARGEGPRRTIRIALWTGEEQGLWGSREYVNAHFATSAGYGQPVTALKPAQATVSAYYNLDNGSGALRGLYLQNNADVQPIFRAWLDAFGDETAQTLTLQNTSGTDHLSFDAAGIPGFQFIQDPLAYSAQTWHTSLDTYDHLSEDDLEQAAALVATFVHHTAQRDGLLPRKPFSLPTTAPGR